MKNSYTVVPGAQTHDPLLHHLTRLKYPLSWYPMHLHGGVGVAVSAACLPGPSAHSLYKDLPRFPGYIRALADEQVVGR